MVPSIEEYIEKIKNSDDFFYKAKLLKFLNKEKQIRVKELAEKINMKPSYLCHILRLNRLPELVVDSYYSKLISISHLFIVSRLKNAKDIFSAYENVLKNNLTVAQTENLIRGIIYGLKSDGKYLQTVDFEETIKAMKEKNPDINLKIIQSRVKSKIIIEIVGSLAKTSPLIRNWLRRATEGF